MSKEYYKKKIIDLRADIAKEKEAKKRDNERYADSRHDSRIENYKRQIESAKDSLARLKK